MTGTRTKSDEDEQRHLSVRDSRRQEALERMADHVLEVGLRGATLRLLATAAETSNRMLLYYFADKNELLTAILEHLAGRLLRLLNSTGAGSESAPLPVLLPSVLEAMRSPAIKPYMQLWLELAALAAREEEPFRAIAGQICDGFLAWAAERLQVEHEAERALFAALLLGTVDGLILLDGVSRSSTTEAALRGALLYYSPK